VRGNEAGAKKITVRLKERDQAVYIWDNGMGMTGDELNKWATMGVSQSDSATNSNTSESYSDKGMLLVPCLLNGLEHKYLGSVLEQNVREVACNHLASFRSSILSWKVGDSLYQRCVSTRQHFKAV
jgi:hypothetical protein